MECKSINSHVSVFSNIGTIKPCCSISIDDSFDLWKQSNIFAIDNLNTSLNLDVRKLYKTELKTGWVDDCSYCENLEKQNLVSARQETNEYLDGKHLEDLQLALDFNCNMTCRICRPGVSSKWDTLDSIITKLQTSDKHHYNNVGNHKAYSKRMKYVLENTNFDYLKRLRIVGGEPFYSPNIYWFLSLLNDKTDLKNISFTCNTNGSVIPNKKIIKLLQKFKSVKIDISIDATNNLAESIRPGVEWNTINENLRTWSSMFDIMISPTVSILNVNILQSLIDLQYDYHFMPLSTPKYLRYTQIPLSIREKWLTTDDTVNQLILMPYEKQNHKIFLHAMSLMDKHMPQFKESNTEIWSTMMA